MMMHLVGLVYTCMEGGGACNMVGGTCIWWGWMCMHCGGEEG